MGTQLPQKKGTPAPTHFDLCLLWPNGWMDEDATWCGSRPWHRPHCIRPGPGCSPKGDSTPLPLCAHVYCGHGRPSQLLLSSCFFFCLFLWPPCVADVDIILSWSCGFFFMTAVCNWAGHDIFALLFLLFFWYLSSFSSPNLSGRRLDVYHTSTDGAALVQI